MENARYIKTLRIYFDLQISPKETVLFRGAILNALQKQGNILFHNHNSDSLRYSYPLIQYKRLNGKACIVCIQEGAEVIGQLLVKDYHTLHLGEREVKTDIIKVSPARILVQTWRTVFNYHLRSWLALNKENYIKYQNSDSLRDKIELLENILKGNLLSVCKGLNVFISENIELTIKTLSEPHLITNKGVKLMAFDVDFSSNLSLPEFIGIGKNASIGYGVLTLNRDNKIKDKQYEQ